MITPINVTAQRILTFKKAKVTPTAKASMLVATARGSMALNPKEESRDSASVSRDSRIILIPMIPSRIKAIQWSMGPMMLMN